MISLIPLNEETVVWRRWVVPPGHTAKQQGKCLRSLLYTVWLPGSVEFRSCLRPLSSLNAGPSAVFLPETVHPSLTCPGNPWPPEGSLSPSSLGAGPATLLRARTALWTSSIIHLLLCSVPFLPSTLGSKLQAPRRPGTALADPGHRTTHHAVEG